MEELHSIFHQHNLDLSSSCGMMSQDLHVWENFKRFLTSLRVNSCGLGGNESMGLRVTHEDSKPQANSIEMNSNSLVTFYPN